MCVGVTRHQQDHGSCTCVSRIGIGWFRKKARVLLTSCRDTDAQRWGFQFDRFLVHPSIPMDEGRDSHPVESRRERTTTSIRIGLLRYDSHKWRRNLLISK